MTIVGRVSHRIRGDRGYRSGLSLSSPRRVLVIDDARLTRVFASRLIAYAGATVMTAADGVSGVRIASRQEFDFILVALAMPDVDGRQTAALLRASGQRMPIVALASRLEPENDRMWQDAGFDAILEKPFTLGAMLAAWERSHGHPASSGDEVRTDAVWR